MSECSISNCAKPSRFRGMCVMHYQRWRRGSDLSKPEERRGLCLSERFWQHIDVGDFDRCWEWTGSRHKQGYGQFVLYDPVKKTIPSHRMAYETFWRTRLVNNALHRCNNPPCCNPLHLYDGTLSQNSLDSVRAGTAAVLRPNHPRARGEANGLAKLTEQSVREIRYRYQNERVSQQRLAQEYGVAQTKISDIILRKTWRHVE